MCGVTYPKIPLGRVVAERHFVLRDSKGREREIVVKLGTPIQIETGLFPCPAQILGLGVDQIIYDPAGRRRLHCTVPRARNYNAYTGTYRTGSDISGYNPTTGNRYAAQGRTASNAYTGNYAARAHGMDYNQSTGIVHGTITKTTSPVTPIGVLTRAPDIPMQKPIPS